MVTNTNTEMIDWDKYDTDNNLNVIVNRLDKDGYKLYALVVDHLVTLINVYDEGILPIIIGSAYQYDEDGMLQAIEFLKNNGSLINTVKLLATAYDDKQLFYMCMMIRSVLESKLEIEEKMEQKDDK